MAKLLNRAFLCENTGPGSNGLEIVFLHHPGKATHERLKYDFGLVWNSYGSRVYPGGETGKVKIVSQVVRKKIEFAGGYYPKGYSFTKDEGRKKRVYQRLLSEVRRFNKNPTVKASKKATSKRTSGRKVARKRTAKGRGRGSK